MFILCVFFKKGEISAKRASPPNRASPAPYEQPLSYGKTCEVELAQAQKAQELATQSSALPLKPATENDFVLTFRHFWTMSDFFPKYLYS